PLPWCVGRWKANSHRERSWPISGNPAMDGGVCRRMPDARGATARGDLGRRRAFDLLYQAHSRAVLAFALRRTSTQADAEDIAAETFIVAWRRLDELKAIDAALPWLYGVARKLIANLRRGTARRHRLDERVAEYVPTNEQLIAGNPQSEAVAALERLRPEDAELLKLVAWEELSHAEIATVLGITQNAVAIRLYRARQRYVAALESRDEGDAMKGSVASRTFASVRGRAFGSPGHDEAR
ncbi:MAG: sigma-70 family RNA polymerase sigma factor, partial [Chloroflexota bacterium]